MTATGGAPPGSSGPGGAGRLLTAVLRLAPRDFRERHGEELLRVHRERMAAAGGWSRVRLYVGELAGAVGLVLRLRLGRGGGGGWGEADVRLALRAFRRHPGYAWTAVAVLALGIGGTAAVFATANAYLFRPLPFADAERLVTVHETNPDFGWTPEDAINAAPANVLDWRAEVEAFEDVAMYSEFVDRLVHTGSGEPSLVAYTTVSGNFFDILGVRPLLGRTFRWEETWADGPRQQNDSRTAVQPVSRPIVLSHGVWRRMFGGDPEIVGRVLAFGDERGRVVGVMPADFRFPSGEIEMWVPYGWDREARDAAWFRRAHFVRPLARLEPGATRAAAAAQLEAVVRRLQVEYPETNEVMGAVLVPFRDYLTRDVRGPLGMLLGAAGLLLLLACVNVATLSLLRAGDRSREVAVRHALGAGRRRVAGLVLGESLTLALLGGAAGLGLGWLTVSAVSRFRPLGIDGVTDVVVDHRVLLAVMASTALAGVVAGAAGLSRALMGDLPRDLKEGGRGGGGGGSRLRGARLLVAAEVALAVLLLAGAGLMVRTAWSLRSVDAGFRAEGVLAVELTIPSDRYAGRDEVLSFQDRLVEALESRPGLESAGIVGGLPLDGPGWSSQFQARGWPEDRVGWEILHRRADRGYFDALEIPLLRGRHLAETTAPDDPREVVINETFAREHFPGEDPLGQEIAYDRAATEESTWRRIVGIVGDQRQLGPARMPRAEVFEHRRQDWARTIWVVVRTGDDALEAVPVLRTVLAELDPMIPLERVRSLRQVWRDSMARETLILRLLGAFAVVALLLAAVGIYGVTAQAARRRTREIGIRMALGAAAGTVLTMVLRQGLVGVLAGIAAGVAAAVLATRLMDSVLFGVEPGDPLTLGAVALILVAVGAIACWVPARRAARTDPMGPLRTS